MMQCQNLYVGLSPQGELITSTVYTYYGEGWRLIECAKGDRFHVIFDVNDGILYTESTAGKKGKVYKVNNKDSNSRYFIVIQYCGTWNKRSLNLARNLRREFTMDHSNKIMKFIEFSIKQKGESHSRSKQ